MEKPVSLSIKEWLIRKLSVKMMISERIIEEVINHQFNTARSALDVNDSIEFSGFGKFWFNKKKAGYKLKSLLLQKKNCEDVISTPDSSSQKKRAAELKLISTTKNIELLKSKLHED